MDIKIVDLNKELNSFDYGLSINGKELKGENPYKNFKTLSPEIFYKYKIGICYDYVNYEAKWFTENGIKYDTYFLIIGQNGSNVTPTHTFLVFKDDNKFVWFESSWKKHKGLHVYKSLDTLLSDVIKYQRGECKGDWYEIDLYKYSAGPSFVGISCDDFIEKITNQAPLKKINNPKVKKVEESTALQYFNNSIERNNCSMNYEENFTRLLIEAVGEDTISDVYSKDMFNEELNDVLNFNVLENAQLNEDELRFMTDILIRESEEDEEDNEAVTEGANSEITEKFKAARKKIKKETRLYKKNVKAKKFADAKKNIKNMTDALSDLEKIIKNTKFTVGEVIIGYFITSLIAVAEALALMVAPGVAGAATAGLAVAGKATAAAVAGTATGGFIAGAYAVVFVKSIYRIITNLKEILGHYREDPYDVKTFNLYRNELIGIINIMKKKVEMLGDKLEKAEDKAKEVNESVDEEKLAIYEACTNGEITVEEREAKLEELRIRRAVEESGSEAAATLITPMDRFNKVRSAIYEKCANGEITLEEREDLIERARAAIFTEAPSGDVGDAPEANAAAAEASVNKDAANAEKELEKNTKDAEKDAQKAIENK